MTEQKQVEKSKQQHAPEESAQEAKDLRNEELTESTEEVLDSIEDVLADQEEDELLADIDDALGDLQEGEALVNSYVQQGGQ